MSWVEPYINGRRGKTEDIYTSGFADCHIELLEQQEIRANLILPIVYNHQLWGFLCAHQCSQPRYWESLEVELLEKLSNQIAIAIQQSQLYQQAQKEILERQQAEINLKKLNEELEIRVAERTAELQQINEDLQLEILERKRVEQELRHSEQRLRDILEREQELSELKSRFVSMTSHEFRTPLTVISSSAGILKDFGHKLDEEKKKKHLDCIQTYVKHTTQLLDDILLINKAENGQLAFGSAPLDLVPFCQKLTEEIQLNAPNHTIIFSSTSQAGVTGNLDKKLLRQILINLLSNAIKYSPHSPIVQFILNITEANVIFTIQDQGIGIPEEDQTQLFESFHRASNVSNIPGTGLGLSIVFNCIKLHCGSIDVNSQVGMGTTFTVTIPL